MYLCDYCSFEDGKSFFKLHVLVSIRKRNLITYDILFYIQYIFFVHSFRFVAHCSQGK